MIEPTESESKAERDRLRDALITIREEIRAMEQGRMDRADNPLKNTPHNSRVVTATSRKHGYTPEQAGFPAAWLHDVQFWTPVGRVDNTYGDRNVVCVCPPMSARSD